MKVAKYSTQRGAEKYARDLAAHFPKRTFLCVPHPYDFAWSVGMYDAEGKTFIAYAGKRKPAHGWAGDVQ
jgi:hypothetical protein